MKRFGVLLASAFLCLTIVGCDSGIEEAKPEDKAKGAMTDEFKALMEKNAANMKLKGKPKDTAPSPTPEKK